MVAGDLGAGRLYLSTVPLDPSASDLARSGEVFVPMLYRMALAGRAARPASYVIGSPGAAAFPLPADIGEEAIRLVGEASEFVPAQRRLGEELVVSFGEAPREAGFYRLVDGGDSTLSHVAFNYDRRESPQGFLPASEMESLGFVVYDGQPPGRRGRGRLGRGRGCSVVALARRARPRGAARRGPRAALLAPRHTGRCGFRQNVPTDREARRRRGARLSRHWRRRRKPSVCTLTSAGTLAPWPTGPFSSALPSPIATAPKTVRSSTCSFLRQVASD